MIAFAWFMLAFWPVVTIVLFRKLPLSLAICVSLFSGYLLLPNNLLIDLPVLPELNKLTIPVLCTTLAAAVMTRSSQAHAAVLPGWIPREKITLIFLMMLILGAFGTVVTNGDPLFYGPRFLQGMRMYDGFSILLHTLMLILPALLARRYLADRQGQKTLMMVLVISALIYTLPALWEVRMSPQLHRQIYGFFPHSFLQQVRQDGFRPFVFLQHGLAVSIFVCLATIAVGGLWRRAQGKERIRWAFAAVWLFLVLVLTKSLGALIIACVLMPLAFFARPRVQLLVAACIAGIVLTYPALRAAHVIPIPQIMSMASNIDPARAQSLQVRIDNEELLLAKASERPLFGWGLWNRSRVYDDEGRDQSITDGAWIIYLGTGGWITYVPLFGLLCWPIIGLFLSHREKIDPVCALLALVLSGKLIDLIPNAGLPPYVWLIAGSLLGRLEISAATLRRGTAESAPVEPTAPTYARALDTGSSAEREPQPPPPPEEDAPRTSRYARAFEPTGRQDTQQSKAPRKTASGKSPLKPKKA